VYTLVLTEVEPDARKRMGAARAGVSCARTHKLAAQYACMCAASKCQAPHEAGHKGGRRTACDEPTRAANYLSWQ